MTYVLNQRFVDSARCLSRACTLKGSGAHDARRDGGEPLLPRTLVRKADMRAPRRRRGEHEVPHTVAEGGAAVCLPSVPCG